MMLNGSDLLRAMQDTRVSCCGTRLSYPLIERVCLLGSPKTSPGTAPSCARASSFAIQSVDWYSTATSISQRAVFWMSQQCGLNLQVAALYGPLKAPWKPLGAFSVFRTCAC